MSKSLSMFLIFWLLPSCSLTQSNTLTWEHNDPVVFLQNKWQQHHYTLIVLLPSILHKVVWTPLLCLPRLCRFTVSVTWRTGCHNWSCKSTLSPWVHWCGPIEFFQWCKTHLLGHASSWMSRAQILLWMHPKKITFPSLAIIDNFSTSLILLRLVFIKVMPTLVSCSCFISAMSRTCSIYRSNSQFQKLAR